MTSTMMVLFSFRMALLNFPGCFTCTAASVFAGSFVLFCFFLDDLLMHDLRSDLIEV